MPKAVIEAVLDQAEEIHNEVVFLRKVGVIEDQRIERLKCIRRYALIVAKAARSHFAQLRESPYIVAPVLKTKEVHQERDFHQGL